METAKIRINWEGSLFVHHSLGMVNRELFSELIKNPAFDIRHIPYEPDQFVPAQDSKFFPLRSIDNGVHSENCIHVKHRWPPDFNKRSGDRLVMILPWEYGSLPEEWRAGIMKTVDEVWVYTSYLKACYIQSGIPESKVRVVPLGVDVAQFNPSRLPNEWVKQASQNRFCFFYNGGVTLRKGTDILVNAYLSEFSADESVCLVIKDSNAYGKNLSLKVRELSLRTDIARIVYSSENINHEDLAGLYTACDCYVHPYRGEGYGLPIAEALACGKPAIVTGGGASLDFVESSMGYFVECTVERMKEKNVGGLATVDFPFWMVPDIQSLRKTLRYVYENREKAAEIGIKAGEKFRSNNTWERSVGIVSDRLFTLSGIDGGRSSINSEMIDFAIECLKSGNYEKAAGVFRELLDRHGECAVVYEGLGIASYQLGRFCDACEYFTAANRCNAFVPDIILNWSQAAEKTGRLDEISNPLRNALLLNPRNEELKNLARRLHL